MSRDRSKLITVVPRADQIYFYYKGRRYKLNFCKGAYYLLRLLENPYLPIGAVDLYYREHLPAESLYFEKLCLDQYGFAAALSGCFQPIPMSDYHTVQRVKQRLMHIEHESQETFRYHDIGRYRDLQDEKTKLLEYLDEVLNHREQIRNFGNDDKKIVNAVYRAINRSMRELENLCPPMAKALRKDLRMWRVLSYIPNHTKVLWQLPLANRAS